MYTLKLVKSSGEVQYHPADIVRKQLTQAPDTAFDSPITGISIEVIRGRTSQAFAIPGDAEIAYLISDTGKTLDTFKAPAAPAATSTPPVQPSSESRL